MLWTTANGIYRYSQKRRKFKHLSHTTADSEPCTEVPAFNVGALRRAGVALRPAIKLYVAEVGRGKKREETAEGHFIESGAGGPASAVVWESAREAVPQNVVWWTVHAGTESLNSERRPRAR